MLEHVKSGTILVLALILIFMWGRVSSLSASLEKSTGTVVELTAALADSMDEIDTQNAKITRFEDDAKQRGEMLVAAVKELEVSLPRQIKQDIADPADAEAMNAWMRGVFPQ